MPGFYLSKLCSVFAKCENETRKRGNSLGKNNVFIIQVIMCIDGIVSVSVLSVLFVCSDAVHGVTCAILLLNSDLHTDVSVNSNIV